MVWSVEIGGKRYYKISDLNSFLFCENAPLLEEVVETEATRIGSDFHQTLDTLTEREFEEKGAIEIPFGDAVERSKTEPGVFRTRRERLVLSKRYGLLGYVDQMKITQGILFVIDDKSKKESFIRRLNEPVWGDEVQLLGYCLCLEELCQKGEIDVVDIGYIINYYPREQAAKLSQAVHNETLSSTDEAFERVEPLKSFTGLLSQARTKWFGRYHGIEDVITQFQEVAEDQRDPIPTKNKNKCRGCRRRTKCDYCE